MHHAEPPETPDPAAEWTDFLIDSLEVDEAPPLLANARPLVPGQSITPKLIRRYFAENAYPFAEPIGVRQYYREKRALQIELVKLQNWVKETGTRIVVLLEGRDAAGKGSTIKRFLEHLDPRAARAVALVKPTEEERGQWYFQRYVDHLPTAGEIVFFDRSWYNRAGVEKVMGFCTDAEYEEFVHQAPLFETMLVRSGIHLIKLYLSVSREEQARRFRERRVHPLKQWKLSPIDREAQERWDAYTEAKEENFRRTDTPEAPWVIVKTEDKMRARLAAMQYVLQQFEYEGRDPDVATPPHPLILARVAQLRGFQED
ncbi:MAG: polyphosphate kinase 2 [Acidobacteria bacterium]|nr:MAG: polyphosphate kinase 2 [Acidobacteriota bacterium]REK03599.1 MAG: polyphosphate kinase 2 [Acidobacteriota bacterium]